MASSPGSCAELVVAVARLGEADLLSWWRSHGMDGVGEYLLEDLFPRTAVIAGAEIAVHSAAKRHADALPDRDDVLQLFGEPFPAFAEALAWLAELKTGGDQSFLAELRSWDGAALAVSSLQQLTAGAAPQGEQIGGTLRLGVLPAASLDDPDAVHAAAVTLAAAYVSQDKDLVVPYYDDVSVHRQHTEGRSAAA